MVKRRSNTKYIEGKLKSDEIIKEVIMITVFGCIISMFFRFTLVI